MGVGAGRRRGCPWLPSMELWRVGGDKSEMGSREKVRVGVELSWRKSGWNLEEETDLTLGSDVFVGSEPRPRPPPLDGGKPAL